MLARVGIKLDMYGPSSHVVELHKYQLTPARSFFAIWGNIDTVHALQALAFLMVSPRPLHSFINSLTLTMSLRWLTQSQIACSHRLLNHNRAASASTRDEPWPVVQPHWSSHNSTYPPPSSIVQTHPSMASVYPFSSYAKSTACPDSDIDIA